MSDKAKEAVEDTATDVALELALARVFDLLTKECIKGGVWDLHVDDWWELYEE